MQPCPSLLIFEHPHVSRLLAAKSELCKFWSHRWIEEENEEEHPLGGGLQTTHIDHSTPPLLSAWLGNYSCRHSIGPASPDDSPGLRGAAEVLEGARDGKMQSVVAEEMADTSWVPEKDSQERILLNCPFTDKDKCKSAGGK